MKTDDVWNEVRAIWRKVFIALNRFIALMVFVGMHWFLIKATSVILPDGWTRARVLLEIVYFISFSVLYVDQVWEMAAVFVPRLGGWRERIVRGNIGRGGGKS